MRAATMGKPLSVDNYRAESDAHTLASAEEIKSDKQRHGAAKKHAKMKAKQMAKVAGVRVQPNAVKQLAGGYNDVD